MRNAAFDLARRIGARAKHALLRQARIEYLGGVLHSLLHANRTDLVLDVGANSGQYARRIRAIGYRGDLVSVEPITDLSSRLEKLAAHDPAWTVHNLALGSADGQAWINVTEMTELSSLLETADLGVDLFGERIRVSRRQAVAVRRLDGLVMDTVERWSDRSIHLKIDTQGSDLEVLRGSHAILARVRTIQVELAIRNIYSGAPTLNDLTEYLGLNGFALHSVFPVSRDPHGRLVEVDGVFVAAPER